MGSDQPLSLTGRRRGPPVGRTFTKDEPHFACYALVGAQWLRNGGTGRHLGRCVASGSQDLPLEVVDERAALLRREDHGYEFPPVPSPIRWLRSLSKGPPAERPDPGRRVHLERMDSRRDGNLNH